MDAKINDIGYTNESISRNYFEAGFDAVICNPFIGEKGLEPVLSTASDLHKDVILLVYMSHESADFGYGRKVFFSEHESQVLGKDNGYFYELFAYLTNKLPICGAIVGGNFPEKVKVIKNLLNKDKIIFSPGIGVQGGNPKQARIAGIDYAIIGRSITEEKNIQENIKKIKKDLE
jgi:orotidine-5'-phosphate decarboxylase